MDNEIDIAACFRKADHRRHGGFYREEYIRFLLEYELYGYEGEGRLIDREAAVIGHTSENFACDKKEARSPFCRGGGPFCVWTGIILVPPAPG